MRKSKVLSAFFVVGLLGVVAFASFGFQGSQPKEETRLQMVQRQFDEAVTQFKESRAFQKIGTVKSLTANIEGATSVSSPLKVRGGSIHAENPGEAGADIWTEIKEFKHYSALSPDNNYVSFTGLTVVGAVTLAPPISGATGWKIEFSNQDTGMIEKPAAVLVCSDNNCDVKSVDPTKLVYFETARSDVKLEHIYDYHKRQDELRFHDISAGCDDYPETSKESSVCSIPIHIKVTTKYGGDDSTSTTYECKKLGHDNCVITIGH